MNEGLPLGPFASVFLCGKPTLPFEFPAGRAFSHKTVITNSFTGWCWFRLMLAMHVSVSGEQIHRVFHLDTGENLMRSIDDNLRRRAGEPLDGVEAMGKHVLDQSASLGRIGIVNLAVGGAVKGKVLSGKHLNLHDAAKFSR